MVLPQNRRSRRRPWLRFALVAAALLSLLVGYYLGQYWQRRGLGELSATVYPVGRPLDYPAGLPLTPGDADARRWRLFVTADTREDACRDLLQHFALVMNRLAAWPGVQPRVRVTLLAYDAPDATAIQRFSGLAGWSEVVSAPPAMLDALAAQLGILPLGADWCAGPQGSGVLVSPRREAWALLPADTPAATAQNLASIIGFVE